VKYWFHVKEDDATLMEKLKIREPDAINLLHCSRIYIIAMRCWDEGSDIIYEGTKNYNIQQAMGKGLTDQEYDAYL